LLQALARRGIAPASIRTVILSHLHFDHIANAECFAGADFLLHESELAYFEAHGANDAAVPLFLAETLLSRPNVSLVHGEPEVLPGIRMICTPGHTGGHVSLALTVDEKRIVLAQDAIKHRGEIGMTDLPGAFDAAAATTSIRRIVEMADIIVPGHDAPLQMIAGIPSATAPCAETITVTAGGQRYKVEV
jgi:glyoxylase-like metal-dependent hydrolase (beta-lactamase superfamily II)